MAMEWLDRVPTKPGRIKITPEDGSPAWYAVMERADDPVAGQEGTPINASNLNAMQKISVEAEADTDYHIAVIGDDGVIRRGKQKSSDIPDGEDAVPLEEIAVTLRGPQKIEGYKTFNNVVECSGGVIVGKTKPLAFVHNSTFSMGATRLKCTNTTDDTCEVELPHESGTLALARTWTQCKTESVEVDEGTYIVAIVNTDISIGIILAESLFDVNGKDQYIDTNIYFRITAGESKAHKITCYYGAYTHINWWYKKID